MYIKRIFNKNIYRSQNKNINASSLDATGMQKHVIYIKICKFMCVFLSLILVNICRIGWIMPDHLFQSVPLQILITNR